MRKDYSYYDCWGQRELIWEILELNEKVAGLEKELQLEREKNSKK